MKKFILATLLATFAGLLQAQIPNGNFETWENLFMTTTKTPADFVSSNFSVYDGADPSVVQTTGVSGKGASLMTQMLIDANTGDTTYESGFLSSGEVDIFNGTFIDKFAVNGKPLKLEGHYAYQRAGSDEFAIFMTLFKNGVAIGMAQFVDSAESVAYQSFSIEIDYFQNDIPDSASLVIMSSFEEATMGTVLNVDEFTLDFGTPNSVVSADAITLTCYPNPANSYIEIARPEWLTTGVYTVMNVQGQQISSGNFHEGEATLRLETAGLPAGTYFIQLSDGQHMAKSKIAITH
jgi:hypothetical protein